MAEIKPKPGSKEAIERGCKCPVMDNHHGKGLPNGDYWISADCPLHSNDELFEGKE